jgi:hypothetical protein
MTGPHKKDTKSYKNYIQSNIFRNFALVFNTIENGDASIFQYDIIKKQRKMKKILTYMTVFAAVVMCLTGCKKDKDPEPSEIATNLVGDWQGWIQEYKRYGDAGNDYRVNDDRKWVVMRFNKTHETGGKGYQVEFKNSYMYETAGDDCKNEFTWLVTSSGIEITYKTWDAVFFQFDKESFPTSSSFKGDLYVFSQKYKYQFDYTKRTFNEWRNYFNF